MKKLLFAAALSTAILASSPTEARQANPQCRASVERGQIASFMNTDSRSEWTVRTPLLESGKHLRLTLPKSYVDDAVKASGRIPEAKRSALVSDIIQRNLGLALVRIGTAQKTSFQCVTISSVPAPDKPLTMAVPDNTTQPTTNLVPSPRTPARTNPRTSPDKDDGSRRRVFRLDDAPRVRPITQMTPLLPSLKGGTGAKHNPYVIEIPVPSSAPAGSILLSRSIDASGDRAMRFELRFVGAQSDPRTTTKRMVGASSLLQRVESVVSDAAGRHHDIRRYVQ
jgi:hypothetical protein